MIGPGPWAGLAGLLLLASTPAGAQLTVGAGASVDIGTGSLDLGCSDLNITGTLSASSSGFTQVRDVTIGPAGVMNGDSATLEVAGNWDNAGTFNAGTSTVQMVDGCGLASAVIAGDTTFANLGMTTTTGKVYSFTSGSTQTVTSASTLLGTSGNLLTIRSTLGGSAAFLDLQGSQSVAFVDVDDNDATPGDNILLGPDSVKGSNTPGWGLATLVPTLDLLGLTALVLALLATARRSVWIRRGVVSAEGIEPST